jgi:hypothetical protein
MNSVYSGITSTANHAKGMRRLYVLQCRCFFFFTLVTTVLCYVLALGSVPVRMPRRCTMSLWFWHKLPFLFHQVV